MPIGTKVRAMKLTYRFSKFQFEGDDGNFYDVIFRGKQGELRATVLVNSQRVGTWSFQHGVACKSIAKSLLKDLAQDGILT